MRTDKILENGLQHYSDAELLREIARRKEVKDSRPKGTEGYKGTFVGLVTKPTKDGFFERKQFIARELLGTILEQDIGKAIFFNPAKGTYSVESREQFEKRLRKTS